MLVCFLSRVTGFAVAAVLFGLSFFPQRADSQEPAAQRAVLQGRSLHSVSIVNAARLALHAAPESSPTTICLGNLYLLRRCRLQGHSSKRAS